MLDGKSWQTAGEPSEVNVAQDGTDGFGVNDKAGLVGAENVLRSEGVLKSDELLRFERGGADTTGGGRIGDETNGG